MSIVLSEEPMPTIYHLHRATVAKCPPCHGQCQQGRACNAGDDEACAAEGGEHHDPAPTKPDRYGPLLGAILALSGWPLVLAVVALIAALAEYLPRIPN